MKKDTAIYALTLQGAELAKKIMKKINADLYLPHRLAERFNGIGFQRFLDLMPQVFHKYKKHIFITATGIAVRSISPFLDSKETDPAVVVLDQRGRYCISLLSGHIGGANSLAKEVASITGGTPVITTATDTEQLPAIDMIAKKKGMAIKNISALKRINRAIVEGEPIQVFDPEERLGLSHGEIPVIRIEKEEMWNKEIPGVWVNWKDTQPDEKKLILCPRCLVVGLGCNKGTEAREILDFIKNTFLEHGISMESIRALATIELKKEEIGLLEAAESLGTPVLFFSSKRLSEIRVPNPSLCVQKHMGTWSVCEAAAIIGAKMGKLIVPKKKWLNTTIAIALES